MASPGRELVLTGMGLSDWLHLMGRCQWHRTPKYWPRMARLTVQSVLNEGMGWEEERQLGPLIDAQTVQDPLFVLGCWRSGTTWLHRMLAQDPQLAAPTTAQVFNPHTFFFLQGSLPGRRARLGRRLYQVWVGLNWGQKMSGWQRPSDAMEAGPNLPGEDEIALLMMGRSDLMAQLLGPNLAKHYQRYLNLQTLDEKARDDWKKHWFRFLQKLTLRYAPRTLVLKSPNHTARMRTLLEIFPKARFLHIHRHPFEVYRSFTRHLQRTAEVGDLLQDRNSDPAQTCLRLYDEVYSAFLEDRPRIPAGQLHEIGFEALERDPIGQLSQAYQNLGLPDFERFLPPLKAYLDATAHYRKTDFAALDPATKTTIRQHWGRYFEAFGYD